MSSNLQKAFWFMNSCALVRHLAVRATIPSDRANGPLGERALPFE